MIKGKPVVALYGGSFDPPHNAHQEIVAKVAALQDIDRVIVMPAYANPFKEGTSASPEQRLQWCQRVFDDPKVLVSDYEVLQRKAVYTIETLRRLDHVYSVKYLVIGSDNLDTIEKWKAFTEINASIVWVVVTRPGDELNTDALQSYRIVTLDHPVSSTAIRQGKQLEQIDQRIRNDVKEYYSTKESYDASRKS